MPQTRTGFDIAAIGQSFKLHLQGSEMALMLFDDLFKLCAISKEKFVVDSGAMFVE